MIKVIMLDLGSVIFKEDWEGLNEEFIKKFGVSTLMRSSYGQEIQNVYDDALTGKKSMADVFNEICKTKGLNLSINELCIFYKEAYQRNKELNKEIIELIKKLKKKFKVVCFTDTNNLHFEAHQEQGILDLFDKKFGSHQIGMRKNNPEAFKVILKKLNVGPDQVLFIDDNIKNIENAKSLGINTIHFEDNVQLIKDLNKFVK